MATERAATRRSRVRNTVKTVETVEASVTTEAPKEVQTLAHSIYRDNVIYNAHKRSHDKTRKDLTSLLMEYKDENRDTDFTLLTQSDDGLPVTLNVSLKEGQTTEIDMVKLKELIGEEAFMEIATATQAKIKALAGQTVLDRVTKTRNSGVFSAAVKASK